MKQIIPVIEDQCSVDRRTDMIGYPYELAQRRNALVGKLRGKSRMPA
ncbi:hypothetical protein [Mesorhizobium sp. ES1-3]|nr:hypothetical protein [Mesorhizobium sp. ES1-3]MBZ9674040.1 hypothetical protein [Mesorhizobium sp. ES1-3]